MRTYWLPLVASALLFGCSSDTKKNPRPDAGTIPDSSVVTDLAVTPDGAVLTDSAVSDGPVIKPDSTTTDSAPPADTLAADFTASTFKIVISEIMANPAKVIDSLGEWLELHNPTAAPIDIGGWRIADEGSDSHVISGSLVIPAGGYVVLALSTDTSKNGGAAASYEVKNFLLANSADEIVLFDGSGGLVDRVAYTSSWKIPAGSSLQLIDPALDNNDRANWCVAASPWASGSDNGTPEAKNNCGAASDAGVPDASPADAGAADAAPADATAVDAAATDSAAADAASSD